MKYNVNYSVHNSRPAVTILSQMNSLSLLPNYILKIPLIARPHLILPSGSGFPTKTLHACLFSPIPAKCPAHLTEIIFVQQCGSSNSSLCCPSFRFPSQYLPRHALLHFPSSQSDTTTTERRTHTTAMTLIVVDQLSASLN